MSLAPYIERAGAAAVPLLADASRDEFIARLDATTLVLAAGPAVLADPGKGAGFMLMVNLAARLYPVLAIEAPAELAEPARRLASAVNPAITFAEEPADAVRLTFGADERADVSVDASGWTVLVDREADGEPVAAPAALAAAAIGIGEVFRIVFCDYLGDHGRDGRQPGALNLVTLDDELTPGLPLAFGADIGTTHLGGVGAIGNAAVLTFKAAGTHGLLVAVDDEETDLTNAQRYVLMEATDVGVAKPQLAKRALKGTDLRVQRVEAKWGCDKRARLAVDCVLTAFDTHQARIDVQAGLPETIYNAWTQPDDLGWSRHEAFGSEPCAACICWPRGRRPDLPELIAKALGQDEFRVALYLAKQTPVGSPLAADALVPSRLYPDFTPERGAPWLERALLDDVLETRELTPGTDPGAWRGVTVGELYRDGVCGSAFLRPDDLDDREVAVPLAHQSALAGIMLAAQLLIARTPELREARSDCIVASFDVMTGFPQASGRPRRRRDDCICRDPDFTAIYAERWAGNE
jgi:hypothetical protein